MTETLKDTEVLPLISSEPAALAESSSESFKQTGFVSSAPVVVEIASTVVATPLEASPALKKDSPEPSTEAPSAVDVSPLYSFTKP